VGWRGWPIKELETSPGSTEELGSLLLFTSASNMCSRRQEHCSRAVLLEWIRPPVLYRTGGKGTDGETWQGN
jgi:hypothetical protein